MRYLLRIVNDSANAATLRVSCTGTARAVSEVVAAGKKAALKWTTSDDAETPRCWLTVSRHAPGGIVDVTHVAARIPLEFPEGRGELTVTLREDGTTLFE